MGTGLHLTATTVPVLAMQPTAGLVAFAELLALAAPDLEARVEVEVAANPALDCDRVGACPVCGGREAACRCPSLSRPTEGRGRPGGGPDLLELLACRRTLAERLLADLRPSLTGADQRIAEYLAGSLDQRGRLGETSGDAAAALGVPLANVERVLTHMRRLGPPGIAARDGRECLLLQLDHWETEHPPEHLVRRILEDHLEALAAGRLGAIARSTGAQQADVQAAGEFIRARLRPYPVEQAEPEDLVAGPADSPSVLPDVLIVEPPEPAGRFRVHVVESRRLGVMVNPLYEELAGAGFAAPDGVRDHARWHVRRARAFLGRLEQRRRTLQVVSECVVERQEGFLRGGPAQLEPLTRAEVASEVGLHESTVSRAVAGKHAQLTSGRVMPLSGFFDGSLAVRELLRRLIAAEGRPRSDAALAKALAAEGHPVARRTVAKYRAQLAIPAYSGR